MNDTQQPPTRQRHVTEEIRVAADQLVATVRKLIHEGNVRRLSIMDDEGQTLLEIPLSVGVVASLAMPVAAALGALAAVASGLSIVVERVVLAEDEPDDDPEPAQDQEPSVDAGDER